MDYLSENLTLLFKSKDIPENVQENIINYVRPKKINYYLNKDIKNIGILDSVQKLFNNIGEDREKAKQLYFFLIDLEKNNINGLFMYWNYVKYNGYYVSSISYLNHIKFNLINLFNNKFYDTNDDFIKSGFYYNYEDNNYQIYYESII